MVEALVLCALFIWLVLTGAPASLRFIVVCVWLAFAWPGVLPLFRGGPPFVPTPMRTVKKMLTLAKVTKKDLVWDVGCGDGRLVFAAAAKGAKSIGFEISIPVYLLAAFRSFFHKNSDVKFADFWKEDFSQPDVVFCYLMPGIMTQFHTKIWPQLKKGTRVVSHGFRITELKPKKKLGLAYLYVK